MEYREKFFTENESDHGWYTCAKCGKKFRKKDVDVDHIVPQHYRKKPFELIYDFDGLNNLQCLCQHCNRSKQDKLDGVVTNVLKHNAKRALKKMTGAVTSVFKSRPKTKKKSTTAKTPVTAKTKSTAAKTSATAKTKSTAAKTPATAKTKSTAAKTPATAKTKSTAAKTPASTKTKSKR